MRGREAIRGERNVINRPEVESGVEKRGTTGEKTEHPSQGKETRREGASTEMIYLPTASGGRGMKKTESVDGELP